MGPAGPTGPSGPQGIPGLNGANGAPGAIQLIGEPETLDFQIGETFENSSTKNLFITGAIQIACNGYFASVNLMTRETPTAAWQMLHHVFKDAVITNIRYPVSFILKPGASFKATVASNNDNTHCPSGLTNFPDVQEWRARQLN